MLGVDSEESDMSFSLSVDDGRLEWGSQKGLLSIFQQKKNLVSVEFWTMLKDVHRFGKEAPKVLGDDSYRDMTLGNYLDKHKYSRSFTYNYVLPMCAAIWSVSNKTCLEFPIQVRGWHWPHSSR
jgi:predicted NAD/FAD-binding protein